MDRCFAPDSLKKQYGQCIGCDEGQCLFARFETSSRYSDPLHFEAYRRGEDNVVSSLQDYVQPPQFLQ